MRRFATTAALLAALTLTGACSDDADADGDDTPSLIPPSAGVPEDFPGEEIPLADGEVTTQGETGGESGHLVLVTVEGEAEAVREQAIGLLTEAGFVVENTTEVEATGPQTNLASDHWQVLLTAQDDGLHTTLTYNVIPAP